MVPRKSGTRCYSLAVQSVRPLSVYKTKPFTRFARRARIPDSDLWNAAQRANNGRVDADLGGGVIKQRIARAGEGKSGGSRSILAFSKDDRAVYVYGFEKKDQDNIDHRDLEALRRLAAVILGYNEDQIADRVIAGDLLTIHEPEKHHAEKIPE